MKLSSTVFDLAEYIEPYPQLEKIDAEAIKREFLIANDRSNQVSMQNDQNSSRQITQTMNSIRDADSSSKSWIFRTFDQPLSIQKFYGNKMHHSNWSIIAQSANSIQMKSGRMMLKILFPRNPDGTLLIYSLHQSF